MTGALLSFSAMAVPIRGHAGKLSIFEILTARSAVAVMVLLSLAALVLEVRAGLPLDFLRLRLIAIIGWLFFGEPLDLFVFAGALLMTVGILWNLRSETRRFARLQLEETP